MGNSQTSEDTNKKSPNVKISEKEYKKYIAYKNSLKNKKEKLHIPIQNNNNNSTHYNNKEINSQIDSGVQNYQYFNSNIQYDRNVYQNFGAQSKNDPRFNIDPNKLLEQEMNNRNINNNSQTNNNQNSWANNYNKIKNNFTNNAAKTNTLIRDYKKQASNNYNITPPTYNNPVQNYNNSTQNFNHHLSQPQSQNMYYSNFSGQTAKQTPYNRIPVQQTSLNNVNTPVYIPQNSSNKIKTSKDKFTKEEKLLMINNQVSFYDIDPLGLLKNERLTMKQLLNKYLSLRKLYHPDKGGNTQQFILINSAIKKNMFLQNGLNSDKQFNTLKNNYNSSMKNEVKNRPISFDQNGGFSVNKFNNFFNNNKFNDENENIGYGHMMIPSSKKREDIEIKKKPTLQKNFNKGFLAHKKRVSKEIVKYAVPTAVNKNNNTGFKNLGKQGNNFSGYSKELKYSDYKDAYDESNLINDAEYSIQNKSLEDVKREREKGSLDLSEIQKQAIEEFENKQKDEEYKRKQSFENYQNAIKNHSEKVNSLLIR